MHLQNLPLTLLTWQFGDKLHYFIEGLKPALATEVRKYGSTSL